MKKHGKASISVMLALAAVLLVSLCYLSSQGVQEGMENKTISKSECKFPKIWDSTTNKCIN